jgi:pimeloyl-ACP methyl ester carboxylesterase
MMTNVNAGGVRLNVVDEGSGTPILFVHGFPLSHDMWRGQLQLSAKYRLIVPDLRGFGDSEVVPGKATMPQMADDCAALLDAMHVRDKIVLCGLSMGGYVGMQFVKRHGERLRGLVLCDTRAAADSPEARETRLKMADHVRRHGTAAVAEAMVPKLFGQATFADKPEIVAELRNTIENSHPDAIAAAQLGMAEREDVRAMLPSIAVPTLVVVGREDAISPIDEMRAMAEAVPGAKFHIVEGAGHMSPLEMPDEFNRVLSEFVDSL